MNRFENPEFFMSLIYILWSDGFCSLIFSLWLCILKCDPPRQHHIMVISNIFFSNNHTTKVCIIVWPEQSWELTFLISLTLLNTKLASKFFHRHPANIWPFYCGAIFDILNLRIQHCMTFRRSATLLT